MKNANLPLTTETIQSLQAGDSVLISGSFFTARDAAHKRLFALIESRQPLPITLQNQTVYYAGPCPAPPDRVVGSCGPTTAGRCDSYTPALIENGLKGMIGKGGRSAEVIEAMKKHGAVYFAAIGGAGALYADCVKSCRVLAFEELGAEAIFEFTVENFPAVVAIDSKGNSIY